MDPTEWLENWTHLYAELDPAERQALYALLQARLRAQRRARRWEGWRGWLPRLRATPPPLQLPLLHAGLSFALLLALPRHPLAMPTALGLAMAIVLSGRLAAACWTKKPGG